MRYSSGMTHRSGGRKPRYPRGPAIKYQPHICLSDAIETRAAHVGLSKAELTEYVMAQYFRLPKYAPPLATDKAQEALLPDPYEA